MMKKTGLTALLGIALAGAAAGCDNSSNSKPQSRPTQQSTTVTKVESLDGYKECPIVGRSYSPGFNIDKKVHVSYGTPLLNDVAHSHDIPIQISEPEKFYLFVEIDGRTYVKQVDKETFRDTRDTVMAKYVEKRKRIYKTNSPEEERLEDEFSDLEVISLEPKKE